MTKYAVIAAMDQQGGFSRKGKIPWYFLGDFKHFREITTGHICVMGRTTYEDINTRLGEKAHPHVLPNRLGIVLSTTLKSVSNAIVFSNTEDLMKCVDGEERTVFFIGGQRVFEEGFKLADEVYLTVIPADYGCDLFLPMQNGINNFTMVSNEETESGLRFVKMVRREAEGDDNK